MPELTSICFFSLGAFLGMKRYDFSFIRENGAWLFFLYVGISFLDLFTNRAWYHTQLHNAGVVLGIFVAFYVAAQLIQYDRLKGFLIGLAPVSFFVFAAHEPLLTVLRKTFYKMLIPSNDAETIALYFVIPFLTLGLCILAYTVSGRILPKFTSLISGGRFQKSDRSAARLNSMDGMTFEMQKNA